MRTINSVTPSNPTYATVCIIQKSNDRMVGCGTLVLEHKFIRSGGSVGHIEDIVVDPAVRGKSLGKRIIEALTGISERLGAYKTILDCNKDNIGEHSCFSAQMDLDFTSTLMHRRQLSMRNAVMFTRSMRWFGIQQRTW